MKKEMLRIMQETEYVSVFHAGCISLFLGLSRIHSSTTRTVSILGSTITPQPLHLWFPDQEKLLISSSSTQTGRVQAINFQMTAQAIYQPLPES
ncbi:toll-like receptor 6 isoform X6 [Notamacropus eugenii]|uniref:toll-like receptor 6 isoform X6 n=1 Tax=Notamacropus eugenii TaxID=9315 RepID=UPI003B679C71